MLSYRCKDNWNSYFSPPNSAQGSIRPTTIKMAVLVLKILIWAQFHPSTIKMTILVLKLLFLGSSRPSSYMAHHVAKPYQQKPKTPTVS